LIEQETEAALEQESPPLARRRRAGDHAAWVHVAGGRHWTAGLGEVWRYREVFYFLAWRDIKVRYRQSVFGIGWAVLQPLLLMLVFTAFVSFLHARTPNGLPYPVFSFAALVPWTLFSSALTSSSQSIVREVNIVSKVYFPRVILPLASTAAFVLDFCISFVLLLVLMVAFGVYPTATIVWVPLFTLLALLVSLSVGVLLGALNALYRDIQAVVPLLAQVWLFVTPVAYASSRVPERWRVVYALNPMAGVVDGFRWSLLGVGRPPSGILLVSTAATIVFFVGSLAYFRRADRVFADVV
jgi:lipopolysaccharide transport system permease protein